MFKDLRELYVVSSSQNLVLIYPFIPACLSVCLSVRPSIYMPATRTDLLTHTKQRK